MLRAAQRQVDDVARRELAQIDRLPRRILKRQVVAALRFGEPTPTAAVEPRVPLLPDAALRVADLRHADEPEARVAEVAFAEQLERRIDRRQIRDLAERFEPAIRALHRAVAVTADPDERIVETELDLRAAVRARGLHGARPACTAPAYTRRGSARAGVRDHRGRETA